MISSTISLATHLYSSLHTVQAVGRVFGYVLRLPYGNMAAVKAKTNFNTKHLSKGDPLPPFNSKLRVFNMRYCPYAQRTLLALIAKDLDFEVINVDLVDKPEWLASKSAFLKVPAIETVDGDSIYESLVTVEYLDDVYPQRPLLPKDPVKKAKDKIIVEAIGPIHALFFKTVRFPENVTDQVIAAYFTALDFIQEELKQRGSKFIDGEEPGFADYMIWPWFERLLTLDDEKIKMDEQKYKLLLAYIDNMLVDPVVSQYLVPKEVMKNFLSGYRLGKPNYDILLEN